MQVKDIYSEVARLGFDTLLEDEKMFYQTLNRAILQTAYDLPDKKSVCIRHAPMKNLLGDHQLCKVHKKPTGGELIIGNAEGVKAYYFECNGNGYASIISTDGDIYEKITLVSSGEYKSYKGVIKNGGYFVDASTCLQIQFVGDHSYNVTNVALYADTTGDNSESVPQYASRVMYDMRDVASDFLSFASPVIECADGVPLKDEYDIIGDHTLYLPYYKAGVYYVKYNRRPQAVEYTMSPSEDTQSVDVSQAVSECISLLIASYLWLDDDSDLALHYRSLYQERVARATARERNRTPVKYVTNGW